MIHQNNFNKYLELSWRNATLLFDSEGHIIFILMKSCSGLSYPVGGGIAIQDHVIVKQIEMFHHRVKVMSQNNYIDFQLPLKGQVVQSHANMPPQHNRDRRPLHCEVPCSLCHLWRIWWWIWSYHLFHIPVDQWLVTTEHLDGNLSL